MDYVFNTVSIGHIFLDMLRLFNDQKGTCEQPNGFFVGKKFQKIFRQYLNILCKSVRNLIDYEPKLNKINSPAFVIGDIRGNLEELLLMEKILWQEVPVMCQNLVFLGNYAHFGKWGIECIMYLFALKIIAPNKFFLIRGNLEIRNTQKNGLQHECLAKYGNKFGPIIWNMVNEVFDRMCLAVVIDESVLCVNSSLPTASLVVEDIFKIATDLKDPLVDPIAKDVSSSRLLNSFKF